RVGVARRLRRFEIGTWSLMLLLRTRSVTRSLAVRPLLPAGCALPLLWARSVVTAGWLALRARPLRTRCAVAALEARCFHDGIHVRGFELHGFVTLQDGRH